MTSNKKTWMIMRADRTFAKQLKREAVEKEVTMLELTRIKAMEKQMRESTKPKKNEKRQQFKFNI